MNGIRQVNVTLVAHYGRKPAAFVRLIDDLQSLLAAHLGQHFEAYESGQVHGTIIGLEGAPHEHAVIGANFRDLRGERRPLEIDKLIGLVAESHSLPMRVQVGGFHPAQSYPFTSRGQHPSMRSFRIGGGNALGIGWPLGRKAYPPVLDELRRQFQRAGALHKYHASPDDTDNDFYFVLGRVRKESSTRASIEKAEVDIRKFLAQRMPTVIGIGKNDLSFVAYTDPALPLGDCQVLSFPQSDERPRLLAELFSR